MKLYTILILLFCCSTIFTYGQRNKIMKKFKGEELESFQLGIIEAIDINRKGFDKGGKYIFVYNSKEESSSLDSVMEPLMAKYRIFYSSYLPSFCGTFDDPAYDAGFDFAMDSMIDKEYGKHFIDSLIKVGKKEYQISKEIFLTGLESADSVSWIYCEGSNFRNTSEKAINWNEKFTKLRNHDVDSNRFEIVSNCLNNRIMEFNLSINEEGQVYQVDSFTVKEDCGIYEPIDKFTTLTKFIKEAIQGSIPYPICIYRKGKKKYKLRQSICFHWTD